MKTRLLVLSIALLTGALAIQIAVGEMPYQRTDSVVDIRINELDEQVGSAEAVAATPTVAEWERFSAFSQGVPQVVSLNTDDGTRERLSARQWNDQVLDWLLLTAISESGMSAYDIGGAVFDLPPIRYDYLKATGQFEYGRNRSTMIGEDVILALTPADVSRAARDDAIADIVDRHRKNQAGDVESLELFTYKVAPDGWSAELTYAGALDVAPYLTPEKGYFESIVTTAGELAQLLSQIDDLTYAAVDERGLVLGGRKIGSYEYRGIGLEEAAAVWQSEKGVAETLQEFESYVDGLEARFNSKWNYRTYRTESERRGLEAERDYEWEMLEMQVEQRARELKVVDGSGFSLDPTYDFRNLQLAVASMLSVLDELDSGATLEELDMAGFELYLPALQKIRPQLETVGRALGEKDIVPWLVMIDDLKSSSSASDQIFGYLIEQQSNDAQFQAARYDGGLQGTEAGMVLFYTDLIAKIWAINYLQSAPTYEIQDFVDHTRVKLAPIYERESVELSAARLWFGPTDRGYQTADNLQTLYFERIATRVYSKGNNPLDPANEVQTSRFLAAPIDWWDDHYQEVARFEPEYFRLNEIMKWSLLIGFLSESGHGEALSFLNAVNVDRSHWFPDWARRSPALRFNLWDRIEFYERGYKGTSTEAMEYLWGEVTAGGVSLAPKSLFRNRPQIANTVNRVARRSNINYSAANAGTGQFQTFDGITVNIRRAGSNRVSIHNTPKPELRLRARDSDVINGTFVRDVAKTGDGLTIRTGNDAAHLGEFSVARSGNGFRAGWRAREIDAGQALALRAGRSADPASVFSRDPLVERVVALEQGEGFAVKLRGNDKWMIANRGGHTDSTVGGGWHSRVADAGGGGQSYRLKWVDESTLRSQVGDAVPTNRGAIDQVISNGQASRIAPQIANNPAAARQAIDRAINEELGSIAKLMANGDSGTAISQLSRLRQTYGAQPEFKLWEGLAELSRGRPAGAASSIGPGSRTNIPRSQSLLREIQARLDDAAMNPGGRESLQNLERMTAWQSMGDASGSAGRSIPYTENGVLKFDFHFVEPLRGGRRLTANEVRQLANADVPIYRQNSPGLNNLDWSAPQRKALTDVVELRIGEVVQLPHGDIGLLNPTKLVAPAEPVTSAVGTQTSEMVRVAAQSTSQALRASTSGNCSQAAAASPAENCLYVVMDQSRGR